MRLFELANKPYDLHVYDYGDHYTTYEFVTEKQQYYYININHYDDEMEVEFQAETENGNTQDITNTGNAYRVFATVIKAMKEVMALPNLNVHTIKFSSKKAHASRVKLYDAFIKVLPRFFPGFVFIDKYDDPILKSYYTYEFARKGTR